MKELTKAEEMFLLAIWRLRDNAYGVTIKKQIQESAKKEYTYGTLYGILDQLVQKELVDRYKGDPTPERGGRSKTYYRLSPDGRTALKSALEVHKKVWEGITDLSFSEA